MLIFFHTCTAGAIGTLGFLQTHVLVVQIPMLRSVVTFLEHWLRFDGFEFSLEIGDGMTMGAAVGTAAGVGELVAIILAFFAGGAPFT